MRARRKWNWSLLAGHGSRVTGHRCTGVKHRTTTESRDTTRRLNLCYALGLLFLFRFNRLQEVDRKMVKSLKNLIGLISTKWAEKAYLIAKTKEQQVKNQTTQVVPSEERVGKAWSTCITCYKPGFHDLLRAISPLIPTSKCQDHYTVVKDPRLPSSLEKASSLWVTCKNMV